MKDENKIQILIYLLRLTSVRKGFLFDTITGGGALRWHA